MGTPIKRFIRKVDNPTMTYAWTEALSKKPGFIECDIDGKPLIPMDGMEKEEKQKFISQMSKAELAKFSREYFGLEIDMGLKADEMRDIVKAEKELRDEAVEKLLKELKGKALSEQPNFED